MFLYQQPGPDLRPRFSQPARCDGRSAARLLPLPPGHADGAGRAHRARIRLVDAPGGVLGLGRDTAVVANGTFFRQRRAAAHRLPAASSWRTTATASATAWRRKSDGGARPSAARANNYLGNDADRIAFDAVISTSADQTVVAPGALEQEWMKNGRRYFHFRADQPMLNFYTIQSARYEVRHDRWQDVSIDVYYHRATNSTSTA
jgi:ABC-2 type transport system permease protein